MVPVLSKRVLTVLAVVLIIGSIFYFHPFGLSTTISPSYEGPHTYIYGFQPNGGQTVYTLNDPNPCDGGIVSCPMVTSVGVNQRFYSNTYTLGGSTTQLNVQKYGPIGKADLTISTSMQPVVNPLTHQPTPIADINYSVPDPFNSNQSVQVQGYIVEYNLQVVININTDTQLSVSYNGEQVWVGLYAETWNNYQLTPSDTGNKSIGGWSAPVLLVAVQGSTSGGGSAETTIPAWQNIGQQILDTYSTPQVTTNIGPITSNMGNVNSTLAAEGNAYAPSTYMSQLAYFPITLSNIGATCNGLFQLGNGCAGTTQYPAVTLNFQLYELQLGRYLWTNPTTEAINGTGQCPTGSSIYENSCQPDWVIGLKQWWANPFNLLGVGAYALVALAVVVVSVTLVLTRGKKAK